MISVTELVTDARRKTPHLIFVRSVWVFLEFGTAITFNSTIEVFIF